MIETLLALLVIKHFVINFCMQTEYQWANKGNVKHPGGDLHVFLHAIGTGLVIGLWVGFTGIHPAIGLIWSVIAFEAVTHYITDWSKVNFCKRFGLTASSPFFWWATGFDQLIHVLILILMAGLLTP